MVDTGFIVSKNTYNYPTQTLQRSALAAVTATSSLHSQKHL